MINLTRKELELVQHLADGEKISEVARNQRLSYAYLRNRIATIRAKMNCETTYNVVAKAIRQGLID